MTRTVGRAEERLVRVMAFSLGSASLLFLGLNAPAIITGIGRYQLGWNVAIVGTLLVTSVTLTALFRVMALKTLRRWAALHGAVILLGVASVPWAMGHPSSEYGDSPWIFNITVLAAAAAGVAWMSRVGWIFLATMTLLLFAVASVYSTAAGFTVALQNAVFSTFFMSLFLSIALATRRAGRLLDEAAQAAQTEARASATVAARSAEDARIQALVHDSVLVALLAFARADTPADPQAAEQARRALEAMSRLSDDESPEAAEFVGPSEVVLTLQRLTTEIAPDALFWRQTADGDATIPIDAVDALAEALGEAMRNSLAYAGTHHVNRRVVVSATDDSVSVDILDDGAGFEVSEVGPARLGISVSILGRMHGVAGGGASVDSSPGRGTSVRLWWSRL